MCVCVCVYSRGHVLDKITPIPSELFQNIVSTQLLDCKVMLILLNVSPY